MRGSMSPACSRPTSPDSCRIVLPVDYNAIVQLGDTTTNYQIRAGDRVFVPTRSMWEDLCGPMAPMDPALVRRDALVRRPIKLTGQEFTDLTQFLRTGLLDSRATAERFSALIPPALPSDLEPLEFE